MVGARLPLRTGTARRLRRARVPAPHLRAARHRSRPGDDRAGGGTAGTRPRLRCRRRFRGRLLRRAILAALRGTVGPEGRRDGRRGGRRSARQTRSPRLRAVEGTQTRGTRDRVLAHALGQGTSRLAPGVLRHVREIPRRHLRHPRRRHRSAFPAPRERTGPVRWGRTRFRPGVDAQRLGDDGGREDEQVAGKHRLGLGGNEGLRSARGAVLPAGPPLPQPDRVLPRRRADPRIFGGSREGHRTHRLLPGLRR